MDPLKLQAIQTALIGNWKNAILLNEQILADNPDDIDALNRLAFAYASNGDNKEAKRIYQKVLILDIKNPIATKNLKRINNANGNYFSSALTYKMNNIFIEEPGKTKVVELNNIAEQNIITRLHSGEMLSLLTKRMKIFVYDIQKQYIGMLPDDLSRRLIDFIQGGNQYEAYVKSVEENRVIIFIKETKRATIFRNHQSFNSSDKTKLTVDNSRRSFKDQDIEKEISDDNQAEE